jgi:hypothetical protein
MWQGLTPDIFALFWTLTIHDLYVPGKAYESELEKVGQLGRAEERCLRLLADTVGSYPPLAPACDSL